MEQISPCEIMNLLNEDITQFTLRISGSISNQENESALLFEGLNLNSDKDMILKSDDNNEHYYSYSSINKIWTKEPWEYRYYFKYENEYDLEQDMLFQFNTVVSI
ncbi:hypothetical protein [Morganella sp. GD04133]|uniref:hypothetical protein n=1 Tax=Morganella sp. GD04133 TaxID=2975435 RepID=UPI002447A755|nr:hypothetical protein [Morganella sp. GD04133]MDH0355013.1 hypothetical protein [Morganella sp. GD04133]